MERHLVITGPMGSGKTTVGRLVGHRLGRPFLDSDAMLAARHGVDSRRLAGRRGVPWLHEEEAATLGDALARSRPVVMAAAASTGDLPDLAEVLDVRRVVTVVLTGDDDVFLDRAGHGSHRRPIDPLDFVEVTERRLVRLTQVGAYPVDVGDAGPAVVADRVEVLARQSGIAARMDDEDIARPVVDHAVARRAEDE